MEPFYFQRMSHWFTSYTFQPIIDLLFRNFQNINLVNIFEIQLKSQNVRYLSHRYKLCIFNHQEVSFWRLNVLQICAFTTCVPANDFFLTWFIKKVHVLKLPIYFDVKKTNKNSKSEIIVETKNKIYSSMRCILLCVFATFVRNDE